MARRSPLTRRRPADNPRPAAAMEVAAEPAGGGARGAGGGPGGRRGLNPVGAEIKAVIQVDKKLAKPRIKTTCPAKAPKLKGSPNRVFQGPNAEVTTEHTP